MGTSAPINKHSTVLGIIIMLALGCVTNSSYAAGVDMPASHTAPLMLEGGLEQPYTAPEIVGIETWLNSKPLSLQQFKGSVVLIDFWAYSCINCIRTLPHLTALDKQYRDKGLVIIGVHAPEFAFENQAENVQRAMKRYDIHYPVALDNRLSTWTNFNNHYWPAHYLIDKNGKVVYTHFGEGEYVRMENNIRYLLGLADKAPPKDEGFALPNFTQTPETYLGYGRAANYMGTPTITPEKSVNYSFPTSLATHGWALNGKWQVEEERIITKAAKAALQLNFHSQKVYLVLGTAHGKPITAHIMLNGKPVGDNAGANAPGGVLTVDHHMLYELINQKTAQNGLLEITADAPGLEAYAFTFGE